jgi:DNA-binding NtrC family response regulator
MSYVLVVDDEAPIRNFLRRRLEGWGYKVKEASNATDALERMVEDPASILLIDVHMPDQDGFWLAERIHERWSDSVMIMASAVDDIPSVENSRKLGAVDHLRKPFDRELLLQALRRASLRLLEKPPGAT